MAVVSYDLDTAKVQPTARKSLTDLDNYSFALADRFCTSRTSPERDSALGTSESRIAPGGMGEMQPGRTLSCAGGNHSDAETPRQHGGRTVSTIKPHVAYWLSTEHRDLSSGTQPNAHEPLPLRARFDIATLIAAGVASSLFFLLPVWTSLDRSTASSAVAGLRLATVEPAATAAVATVALFAPIDSPSAAPTPRPRAAIRPPRAARPAPEFVQARADAKPPQSRLSRFLLGDGRDPVRPFPLPRRR
jgi:hypothetical protein